MLAAGAPALDPGLAAFFGAVVPYYAGAAALDDVTRAIGPSPSGSICVPNAVQLMKPSSVLGRMSSTNDLPRSVLTDDLAALCLHTWNQQS